MEEKKKQALKLLSDFKINPTNGTLKDLYAIYNEVFYHNWQSYGITKRFAFKDFNNRCGSGCDKPVLTALRWFVGLGKDKDSVSRHTYAQRIAICKGCKHHKSIAGLTWCGTPLVGGNTKEGKLCGCNMEVKCSLKSEVCSLDLPKWI